MQQENWGRRDARMNKEWRRSCHKCAIEISVVRERNRGRQEEGERKEERRRGRRYISITEDSRKKERVSSSPYACTCVCGRAGGREGRSKKEERKEKKRKIREGGQKKLPSSLHMRAGERE